MIGGGRQIRKEMPDLRVLDAFLLLLRDR